ncbi:MAG: thiamine biosynthesis protein ThiS [Spirochaetae bacterium HGW-Spirochaetae-6]|nr:MAG: thiamine biosynthesis protein ThiS [Spirochaetae bacterium HGW-Spirochaetae-6]
MQVTINGSLFTFDPPLTVLDFLNSKNIPAATTVIELNGRILDDYQTSLKDQDHLEIIRMVGGG